jgi:O-acetyl-ADP-ribose deacetylase (regulator of RNase III)
MIKYIVNGNIFDSKAHAIVNTVNCEGFMGKGLALQFKQRYPTMDQAYQRVCKAVRMKPGRILPYEVSPERLILSVSTKNEWRKPSRLEWIGDILERLVKYHTAIPLPGDRAVAIRSLAISKLGCGNGHLEWSDVGPLMAQALQSLPITVEIYVEAGDTHF